MDGPIPECQASVHLSMAYTFKILSACECLVVRRDAATAFAALLAHPAFPSQRSVGNKEKRWEQEMNGTETRGERFRGFAGVHQVGLRLKEECKRGPAGCWPLATAA